MPEKLRTKPTAMWTGPDRDGTGHGKRLRLAGSATAEGPLGRAETAARTITLQAKNQCARQFQSDR